MQAMRLKHHIGPAAIDLASSSAKSNSVDKMRPAKIFARDDDFRLWHYVIQTGILNLRDLA
jgi:hypothetical protein